MSSTPTSFEIPKIFHQYWSERPFPAEYLLYQETWLHHNPDWELRFWTPENLFDLELQECFDTARHHSHPDWIGNWKSHVVRYEALYRFGGVWLDSDMECLRPLGGLLSDVECFLARDRPSQVQTAIMGAVAGHSFFGDLMADTARMLPNPIRICASVIQANRVIPQHREVTVLEPWTFYPIDRATGEGTLRDAYGVHWPRAY